MNERALSWRLLLGALLAGGAVAAAALSIPVPPPAPGAPADPAAALPEGVVAAAPEDLTAFLDIQRWGEPPPAPQVEPAAEEPGPVLNPVLARMGYVGLIAAQDELAVLLALPEGEIVRMLPGDTLPDGRILVSVADNSLRLEAEGGVTEVLTLFPPLPGAPASSRADSGASGVSGGDATVLPGAAGAGASQ